jgi:hypothetical protein
LHCWSKPGSIQLFNLFVLSSLSKLQTFTIPVQFGQIICCYYLCLTSSGVKGNTVLSHLHLFCGRSNRIAWKLGFCTCYFFFNLRSVMQAFFYPKAAITLRCNLGHMQAFWGHL